LFEIIAPQPFRLLTGPDDLLGPDGKRPPEGLDPWSAVRHESAEWPSHFTALVRHVFGDSLELNIPRRWACEPPDDDSQELRCFDRKGGPGTFWVRWSKPERETLKEAIEDIERESIRCGDTILGSGIVYSNDTAILAIRQAPDENDRGEDGGPLRTYAWDVAYETKVGLFVVTYALMLPEAVADEPDFIELFQVMNREIPKARLIFTLDILMRTMIRWDDGIGGPTAAE
jgi:hypothetical protein